ncbi:MAG TPA: 4-demethylwyosine synthase TYW1 [Euryarchaeota archaeon]|nr:4-demethylwyosine synthase TYW1 [Euryarchaeota archaeon]
MAIRVREDIRKVLEDAGYRIYNHSGVEVCTWTKKALTQGEFCYKNKFYGVDTHRCMQISQAVAWCTNRCIYCWRATEDFMPGAGVLPKDAVDAPGDILERLREMRAKLLSGFGGNEKVDRKMYEEALLPNHVTFSLMGEPFLYPYVPESVQYILDNWRWVKSVFIVTNGMVPDEVQRMKKMGVWPTQFYVSFTAPDPATYRKVSNPLYPDYWGRFLETLRTLSDAPVRKAARITLIRGYNDFCFDGWAELIQVYRPHFVEVKAYMYIGRSRQRLKEENMPTHDYIREWAAELCEHLDNFEHMDEHVASRVVVLKNVGEGMDIDPVIRGPLPNLRLQKRSGA